MTLRNCHSIILAAGMGTRMKSELPKVMHEIGGLPLVGHVLKALKVAGSDRISVVVGPEMQALEKVVADLAPNGRCFVQKDRLGTAHATLAAEPELEQQSDDVLVLFGDTPLLTTETIQNVRKQLEGGADLVVVGFETSTPQGYGRLLIENDQLTAIREDKDATDQERKVTFCNAGFMGFSGRKALELMKAIGNDNANSEYYLTDAVEIANKRGLKVVAVTGSEIETQGINTRAQLASCETDFQNRLRQSAMENGVTLQAPETVFFSHDTIVEPDVVIEQNVIFGPGVNVTRGARIRAFSHLEGASVGAGSVVGPYARLRPGAVLGANTRVGNFVEVKNATFGAGAKANHLSYIGDASIGSKSNIGAGTITCNYDGYLKHRTEIGAGSFIGSNSTLVAPVRLGNGVFVGAGSVVTKDAATDTLAVGRSKQVNMDGKAKTLRDRLQAAKNTKS
ncbi:MAG: bifunctional UDP-N-acetylglucosamine diphosphorylase/glucosamine-1-phosphate N-acetyltransferase GlmU [Roseibium sp.]